MAEAGYSLGRVRDRVVHHRFTRSSRQACMSSMKQERRTSLMPTSYLTPGPGEYTAYTTFGQASGPTRRRYLATNPGDNTGNGRVAEKFVRNNEEVKWGR